MARTEPNKDRVVVPVEKLVYGGDALARVNGQVLLVPFSLPGEEVAVETAAGKGRTLRGKDPQIVRASPERVAPRCEYFGTCGGCQYQHASYRYQLEQKTAILRETLTRTGSIRFEGDIRTLSGEPWEYRNRIQLHFERGQVGYRPAGSHGLCAIDHCPIASPKLNEVIAVIAAAAKRREWPGFLRSLELFTDETQVQLNVTDTARPVAARFFSWCAELIAGYVPGALAYRAAGFDFRISGGTFFQVNRLLVDALVEEVLQDYRGTHVLDLYSGAGLFSLPLASRFERVTAVERGGSAVRDLEVNLKNAGKEAETVQADAEEYLAAYTAAPDLIVLDPPRAGLGPEVVDQLLRIGAGRLVIVSCDPATLARDLKRITERYEMERLTMADLFPQTFHLETVVHLKLKL